MDFTLIARIAQALLTRQWASGVIIKEATATTKTRGRLGITWRAGGWNEGVYIDLHE